MIVFLEFLRICNKSVEMTDRLFRLREYTTARSFPLCNVFARKPKLEVNEKKIDWMILELQTIRHRGFMTPDDGQTAVQASATG